MLSFSGSGLEDICLIVAVVVWNLEDISKYKCKRCLLQDLEDICFNGFEATPKTWIIIILCGRSLV